MRKVGDFKLEKEALVFWSFLSKEKIDSSLEEKEGEEGYEIWISDEDQINEASFHYQEFLKNHDDPKFKVKLKDKRKPESLPESKKSGFKQYNLGNKWRSQEKSPGVVTLALIITSVAVFLISGMGKNTQVIGPFFISEEINGGLDEIISGQFWRLITPIFLHFNLLHILFNCMWLHSLGSQIEKKKGTKFFITFILCTAIVSNLSQFLITGPAFGGMSGVVYGLFGYVWIKSRLDPGDGFYIDPVVAMIMLGFFLVCFTGAFGGVANWAHAGGLIVGLGWGYGSAFKWNLGGKKN
jgi:GlpG protein